MDPVRAGTSETVILLRHMFRYIALVPVLSVRGSLGTFLYDQRAISRRKNVHAGNRAVLNARNSFWAGGSRSGRPSAPRGAGSILKS